MRRCPGDALPGGWTAAGRPGIITAIAGDELRTWYGDADSPVVRFEPIRLAAVLIDRA